VGGLLPEGVDLVGDPSCLCAKLSRRIWRGGEGADADGADGDDCVCTAWIGNEMYCRTFARAKGGDELRVRGIYTSRQGGGGGVNKYFFLEHLSAVILHTLVFQQTKT
jgi:hypothetical protein